ncbi:12217_t:CDS:2, partial [Gigaspora margarita]
MAENLQKQREVDEFLVNNSTEINIEGSGNLYDIQPDEVNPPDLQNGINSTNTDAGPALNEATKNKSGVCKQEAVVIEQDINMAVVTSLLEVDDPRINPPSEEVVIPNNMESTSNINQADSIYM